MSHAVTLTLDILDYVSKHHPTRLEALEGEAESISQAINCILAVDPPGAVLTDRYREICLMGWVEAYKDILMDPK